LGSKKWRRAVKKVVETLRTALEADYVVLGGGNARKLNKMPKGARLGNNDFAFLGGFRMWRRGGIGVSRPPRAPVQIPSGASG
jgi:6-phosphogluconate dehydrogenase (decarboxylating)